MSLYYEDFDTDRQFVSRGRTVTEADVVLFAGISGDFVELHTNEEYAKRSLFGRRIAHGALIFSISTGLTTQMNLVDGTILAFSGVDKLRFVQPVFIGDTIHVRKRVLERQEMGEGRGVIVFETKVINQQEETVLIYHDKLLIKRRPIDNETNE